MAAFFAAVATGLLCRIFQAPPKLSAQICMGIMGFVGGGLTARAASHIGAGMDTDKSVLIAVTWSLVCAVAVTPLFLTSGDPLRMAIRTIIVFALAGGAGGILTMKDLCPGRSADDQPTVFFGVLCWAGGFGAAAALVSALGPLAGHLVPAPVGLLVVSLAAAAIVGVGAGLSIQIQRTEQRPPWRGLRRLASAVDAGRLSVPAAALVLTAAPFYLNDFSNIAGIDWQWWLTLDYTAVKLFPLAVWLWLAKDGWWTAMGLGRRPSPMATAALACAVAALFGVLIDQNASLLFGRFPGWFRLGRIPEITSPLWHRIDLIFGLGMVAVVEELLFRGLAAAYLTRFTRSPLVIIIVSAAAFGLIHWSGGMVQVLSTAAVGALFMALYLETGALSAIMVAHFIVNFVDFADFVPKVLLWFM
ncbi:MAG: CPBP family intramembrane glutamic endopeptidase [Pseudomonadota bacterium]